jgi:hypothetical protein
MSDFLASLSHDELMRLRHQNPDLQDLLAPYEHRAFAREYVGQNPLGALGMIGAIPGYQLYKMTGRSGARSNPSLDQMVQGFKGTGEGLMNALAFK